MKYNIDSPEVIKILDDFEFRTLHEVGVANISGGFCTVDLFDYDNEYFDIEVKFGVQSDCQNYVETEQYIMNRETLEIEDA